MNSVLEIIEVQTHCQICRSPATLRTIRGFLRVAENKFICEGCTPPEPAPIVHVVPPDDPNGRWREICPKDFLTRGEGGRLDPDGFPLVIRTLTGKNLWLHGPPGSRKTATAWRVARLRFDQGMMIHAFRQLRFGTAYMDAGGIYKTDDWIKALCAKDTLFFVDDLGKTDWTNGAYSAFWEIIDARNSDGLQTIITSQHSPQELMSIWQSSKNERAREIAQPLGRRFQMGHVIKMK